MTSLLPRLRALLLIAAVVAFGQAQANTMVRVHTTQGPIDMTLLDSDAPRTVANFLTYVREGSFVNDFFHRSVWLSSTVPFVIQAGGYTWSDTNNVSSIPTHPPVANEFSATRSNVRGTVAMAKTPTSPDSATSEWFINMSDNSANLDNQNGGFSVFARVTPPGMAVADRIVSLPRVNAGGDFTNLPVVNFSGTTVARANVVLITEVTEFPAVQTTSDRIFNYLEASFPQYASPSKAFTGQAQGYDYRYYSGTNVYVGTRDNQVWYLLASGDGVAHSLGSIGDWLAQAQAAGY